MNRSREIAIFLGVPIVLIAGVLVAVEWQRHRLAQPPTPTVDPAFETPMAVIYPSTDFVSADKINPAPLYCRLIECRRPATIIDTQGRTASIPVLGYHTAQPAAFSPSGTHVAIADLRHVFTFTDRQFNIQDGIETDGEVMIDDRGTPRVINPLYSVPNQQGNLPGTQIITVGQDQHEQVVPDIAGIVNTCDGHTMLLDTFAKDRAKAGMGEYDLNPETGRFETGMDHPDLVQQEILATACHGDGTGTRTMVAAIPPKEDNGTDTVQLFSKSGGGAFTQLTQPTEVPLGFLYPVPNRGVRVVDGAVWVLTYGGQIRRVDLTTGEATTAWELNDPFNEMGRLHAQILGDYVVFIGIKFDTTDQHIARVYDLKTGAFVREAAMPLLTKTYDPSEIQHIEIHHPEAFLRWLETLAEQGE